MYNEAKYFKWREFFDGVLESLAPFMQGDEKHDAWQNALEDALDSAEEDR